MFITLEYYIWVTYKTEIELLALENCVPIDIQRYLETVYDYSWMNMKIVLLVYWTC